MQPLAVVTGASTGIGLEIARELARRRYDLVVCADKPMRDAAELERAGADVTEVVADLSSAAGVEALIRAVQNRHQPLTVLALNVGIARGGLFLDTPLADQLRVVDLNIRSTVHVAHELLPAMITRGQGRVLLTSSVASALPGPYQATYNASKSFVESFGEALRVELAGTGVTLTLLRPGAPVPERQTRRRPARGGGQALLGDEIENEETAKPTNADTGVDHENVHKGTPGDHRHRPSRHCRGGPGRDRRHH